MPNTLIIPNSGTIFFSNDTAGASTTPSLTGQAVSLAHDGQAGLVVSSLNTATSATNRFRVNGANGALLAVTDEITGTVFSVNDPAGLPIISADTGLNDVITMGTFGSNALVVRNDRVGVGTSNPNTSSALEINSTTRGVLPPRMTISQRNAIASPAEGLVVYVNDAGSKGISLHNGTAWGNVLTTHAASFTSDTLAAALSDENGTGGGFVRAEGATLTSPSLVGPVNLTSQDASTADRVMTRELGDARYSRFIDDVVALRLPLNNFSSTTAVSGGTGVVFGSTRACFVSVNAASNARVWVNHFPGFALNAQNTGNMGFNAQNPFTIIIPMAAFTVGENTRAWLRFGSPSAFIQDYSTVEPSGSDTPSIGWVVTRQTTTELDMRLYTWDGTTLNYSPVVTAAHSYANHPLFIILSGDGTNLRLRVVNRLRQVVLDTSIPTIPLTASAVGSLGLINNGTAQAGNIRLIGNISALPYEIQL